MTAPDPAMPPPLPQILDGYIHGRFMSHAEAEEAYRRVYEGEDREAVIADIKARRDPSDANTVLEARRAAERAETEAELAAFLGHEPNSSTRRD